MLYFRDARERDVAERVHKHTLELREKRRQAGLIPHPSAELLEAENQLAKVRVHLLSYNFCMWVVYTFVISFPLSFCLLPQVMAHCEDQRPTREYRLTAFTGELPLGH